MHIDILMGSILVVEASQSWLRALPRIPAPSSPQELMAEFGAVEKFCSLRDERKAAYCSAFRRHQKSLDTTDAAKVVAAVEDRDTALTLYRQCEEEAIEVISHPQYGPHLCRVDMMR